MKRHDRGTTQGGQFAPTSYSESPVDLGVVGEWLVDLNPGEGVEFRITAPDACTGYEIFVDGLDVVVELSDFTGFDDETGDYPKFTATLATNPHELAAAQFSRGHLVFPDEETAGAFTSTPADHVSMLDDLAESAADRHGISSISA
jgi:hypothetical protein